MGRIRKALGRAALGSSIACLAYTVPLGALSVKSLCFSERITSQEQLERVVREEQRRLNITTDSRYKIIPRFHGSKNIAEATAVFRSFGWGEENIFYVDLGGIPATRDGVAHELAHIANNDFHDAYTKAGNSYERKTSLWYKTLPFIGLHPRYIFVEEPRAVLYAATGIRL